MYQIRYMDTKLTLLLSWIGLELVLRGHGAKRFSCRIIVIEIDLVIGVRIVAKSEELAELEEARVVHQLLALREHNCDKDQGVKDEHHTIDIEPVLCILFLFDHSETVDVGRDRWKVDEYGLKYCQSSNQAEVPQTLR